MGQGDLREGACATRPDATRRAGGGGCCDSLCLDEVPEPDALVVRHGVTGGSSSELSQRPDAYLNAAGAFIVSSAARGAPGLHSELDEIRDRHGVVLATLS